MGRVFTLAEIASRQIPRLGSFTHISDRLRAELAAAPSVTAALMCGSFLRSEHNIRSDIDVLVLYPVARRSEAIALMERLQQEARELFVPVQFISLHTELAAFPCHHIASTFLGHFRLAEEFGGCIKGEPLKPLYRRTEFRQDVRAYLSHKLRAFEKGEVGFAGLSEEGQMKLLEKALSFPVYAARMMIQCHEGPDGLMLAGGDGKAKVTHLYPSVVKSQEATDILSRIVMLDEAYSAEIERQQAKPDLTHFRYLTFIEHKLKPAINLAWRFAWLNLQLLG